MVQELSVEIVTAVAEAEGVEPVDLDFTLADYIDCDALNRLWSHGNGTWMFSFELPDHTVTVSSDGSILVDSQQDVFKTQTKAEC